MSRAPTETSDQASAAALARFYATERGSTMMPPLMLDGYLTGVVACPGTLPPSLWLDEVWGEGGMRFESLEEANAILAAVVARYNMLNGQLNPQAGGDPRQLELPFAEDDLESAVAWCSGFMIAFGMGGDFWEPLMESEHGSMLIMPIAILADPPEGVDPVINDTDERDTARREMTSILGRAVMTLLLAGSDLRGGTLPLESWGRPIKRGRAARTGTSQKSERSRGHGDGSTSGRRKTRRRTSRH